MSSKTDAVMLECHSPHYCGPCLSIRSYIDKSVVKLSHPSILNMTKPKFPLPLENCLTTPLNHISGLKGVSYCLFQFGRLLSAWSLYISPMGDKLQEFLNALCSVSKHALRHASETEHFGLELLVWHQIDGFSIVFIRDDQFVLPCGQQQVIAWFWIYQRKFKCHQNVITRPCTNITWLVPQGHLAVWKVNLEVKLEVKGVIWLNVGQTDMNDCAHECVDNDSVHEIRKWKQNNCL